ncbi:hypothetical protein IFM51744_05883 [Aspergillus udagawae]|nr:hypothetical protein IFM51744_05883 [Aspergillus udagawae]
MKARVRKLRFPGSVRLSSRAVVTVCHEHAKFAGRVRQNAVVAHQYAGSVKSWELGVSIPFLGGSGRNDYENLLREIGNTVDSRTSKRIKSMLDKYALVKSTDSSSDDPQSAVTPQEGEMEQDEPPSSPSSIGSLDGIDQVDEDLNRTEASRATGYMGKNSEVTWMQRLRREAEQRVRMQSGALSGAFEKEPEGEYALHAVNYHLDDLDIAIPGPVEVYWMPPRHVADRLFEDYMTTVHPFFPIISGTLFRTQYRTFFKSAARPGDKWLAILNMIFAVASKHARLTHTPLGGDEHDHLVYFTRARILSMNGDTLFSHPDLQQVQVEGLIAFYLLASNQINRAWRIASLAVRSAISLGLNMENTSDSMPNVSKEARYRLWWCLYTLEHMLGIMTGRSTCILDGVCTTPMPLPFEEDQLQEPFAAKLLADQELRQAYVGSAMASSCVRQTPRSPPGGRDAQHTDNPRKAEWLKCRPSSYALCYFFYTDLTVISQEIVNRVYTPDCAHAPWAHIENRIWELRARIDRWYSDLPEAFDFVRHADDQDQDVLRPKLFLAFHFYSARITLGRPCLCRRDARLDPNKKPSFSHQMAEMSLESAQKMLELLPDQPNGDRLYQICPWWCILHFMMQAATILLLELSFGSIHMPEEEQNLLGAAKKAIRWLYAMSKCSTSSRRAWQLCDSNLRRIAYGMNYDISDMPKFVYKSKPNQPIRMQHHNANPSDTTSVIPAPMSCNAMDDLSLSSLSVTDRPHKTYQYYQNPPPPATSHFRSNPHFDLLSSSSSNPAEVGAFFPYDSISGEFTRPFFPNSTTQEP